MNLSLAVIPEMFCVTPLSFRLTTGWQSSLVEVDSVPALATSDGESTPRVTWPTTWRRSRYSCTTTTAWHSYKSGGRSQYTGHNQVSSQHDLIPNQDVLFYIRLLMQAFFDHFCENSRRKKLNKSKNSRPFWGRNVTSW